MTAIADLDCAALSKAYRGGALSPVDVTRDVLARIERHAAFNAFVVVDGERALDAARQSEARWRAGAPLGPLDGVPATVKDNILAKGFPTRRGSRTTDAVPASEDAPAVARLREQGAVILGKTCMPEHGWIGVCHSPLTGITRNPWNPEHTPGGSTGGGAVAALLGFGLVHLGTDGAGSLRIPAAFTGVTGIKPSCGRVPVYPAVLLGALSHHGPVARSVADAALTLAVIAQPDARDMAAWTTPAPDFTRGLEEGVRGLRVAFSARLGQAVTLDPEIEAAARKAARALQEQGALVEEADPLLDHAPELIRAIWWPVAAAIVDSVPPGRRGEMDAGFLAMAERGRKVGTGDYLAATTARGGLHNAMRQFHQRYDLLLTPTMPLTALKVGREGPEEGSFGDDWVNWSPYTYPFNLTGQPAASVPCGLAANGLPIGAQIVGPLGADQVVLRAARVIEQALAMPRPPGI
jgi:aspartyl-tRNA(Asn)/glutamyl-tRNA(Gln) amidotransferase subunit A